MTAIKDLIDKKRLPSWMVKNSSFKSLDNITKIFPKIGLHNFQEEIVIDNSEIIKASAIAIVLAMHRSLSDISYNLCNYTIYHPRRKPTAEKLAEINYWGNVCFCLSILFAIDGHKFLVLNNNKYTQNLLTDFIVRADGVMLPIPIPESNVLYRRGESLFRVYNKIFKAIGDIRCGVNLIKLEKMPEFKRFSKDNIPSNKFYLQFSSDGVDGLWDIITMSMRGISSCQSWSGQYKNNLIGSIADPCAALIYLTSGSKFNEHGTKMMKRSIVRFCVDNRTKKPHLLIDRMYPEYDQAVYEKIVSVLKEKTNDKFPIVYGPLLGPDQFDNLYIPESKIVNAIPVGYRSYQDTKIKNKKPPHDNQVILYNKNVISKQNKLITKFGKSSSAGSSEAKSLTIKIKGDKAKVFDTIVNGPDLQYIMSDYGKDLGRLVLSKFNIDQYNSSSIFMKKIYFYYLANRSKLLKEVNKKFTRRFNHYYALNKETKLTSTHVGKLIEPSISKIDEYVKIQLRELVSKKSEPLNIPGP